MITFDARVTRGAFSARFQGSLSALSPLTVIRGPSGSGKTTLLDLIAGLVPAIGSCTLEGLPLDPLPAHRRGIGYAFQDDRLFPHLSVQDNLRFSKRTSGRTSSFDAIVEALDLTPLLSRKPRDLSGGEKRRVGIGRAILAAERLLLLDEPLSPLDAALRTKVAGLVHEAAKRIPTIVVSHEPLEGEAVSIESLRD